VHTAEMMAKLRGVNVDELAGQTSRNFFTLFNKAKLVTP
jgi:Tat protein secretion system quality control protein TatD with DNase activity